MMSIGYSLCGFEEICAHEASVYNLPGALPIPDDYDGEYEYEDIIDYLLRLYNGTRLKI